MNHTKTFILILLLFAAQFWYFNSQLQSSQSMHIPQPPLIKGLSATNALSMVPQLPSFSELAELSKPAVVSIEIMTDGVERDVQGVGSGFVISTDGYILTNNHVTERASKIIVKFADYSEYDATLVGSDAETDLALLKIPADNLHPLTFGDVEQMKVGSWVVAIGAPFGFEQTVTAGILSAKGRSVGEQYIPYLQTDVAINVGNSGGPLIDLNGKVVGVNSKIISTDGGSLGLSFAIPIDLAMDVIDQLKSKGKVTRGFIGVGYQEVTKAVAQRNSLEQNHGALLNTVTSDSPAARGGLMVGDIVQAVNGTHITNFTELPFLLGRIKPGSQVELLIVRGGKSQQIQLEVGSRQIAEF